MATHSLSQLWAALWLAVVYQAAGLRVREGRQWWLFEHIEGGKVWEQAVKEEGLDPSTISSFGRRVPKYPRSVVEGILRLSASKIRNYNFMGTYFWESPPGTMAGAFEVPKDAMQRNRHWAIDAARRRFGPGDLFIITDYHTRGKAKWKPLGAFDNTTARVPPQGDVFPGISATRAYLQTMRQSRFTLCPAGEEPWSTRLFEAVLVGSLPVVRSRYGDMCAHANGNVKPLQHVYDMYRALSIDRFDELPAHAPASSLYRQDWVDENLRTFIRYQTFMEGDNQPPGAAGGGPLPACEGRLLPPGRSGRGDKVLLVLVGLLRSITAQWPLLRRRLVDPQTRAGYTFEIVVHTSTADSDAGDDAVGALRRLLQPWDATVVDRVDKCTMLTPNMQPGERCVHADLPGTRHISCGTMHFASRAVHALRPHMHDPDLDKVLVIRSDRHLVPDPPPKWSHVAPGYAGPVGTMPVPARWSFSFRDACGAHPGASIIGSAQITNGFAADHDPDWAWLLCDPSRLDLFVEALASAGLPCSPGCRPPYAAAPSKEGKGWLGCDGGWCRSAEVLDGKMEFGTLKGYALASV